MKSIKSNVVTIKDESQKINWLLEDQYAYAFEYINYSQDSFKQLQSLILEMKKK